MTKKRKICSASLYFPWHVNADITRSLAIIILRINGHLFQDQKATRGDGSFEDLDKSETGSEDNQGHPPDDWRIEDQWTARTIQRLPLRHPIWPPSQPFPPFLTPCHLLFLEPIIVVMHFSFYPSKTFAFLNTGSPGSWDKINSFKLLNYKSAGLGGVVLISFSFV